MARSEHALTSSSIRRAFHMCTRWSVRSRIVKTFFIQASLFPSRPATFSSFTRPIQSLQYLAVQSGISLRDLVEGKILLHLPSGALSHLPSCHIVFQHPADSCRQVVRLERPCQVAGPSVFYEVRHTSLVERDARCAARHRLHDHVRQVLHYRGDDEYIRRGIRQDQADIVVEPAKITCLHAEGYRTSRFRCAEHHQFRSI